VYIYIYLYTVLYLYFDVLNGLPKFCYKSTHVLRVNDFHSLDFTLSLILHFHWFYTQLMWSTQKC